MERIYATDEELGEFCRLYPGNDLEVMKKERDINIKYNKKIRRSGTAATLGTLLGAGLVAGSIYYMFTENPNTAQQLKEYRQTEEMIGKINDEREKLSQLEFKDFPVELQQDLRIGFGGGDLAQRQDALERSNDELQVRFNELKNSEEVKEGFAGERKRINGGIGIMISGYGLALISLITFNYFKGRNYRKRGEELKGLAE